MTTRSNAKGLAGLKPRWFAIVRLLFIVALVVILFLLGQSMVHHRFFRGGWVNRQGTTQP